MEISVKEMEANSNSISDIKVDASFRKIPKNAICFHIWKIDEDRLEAEPKSQYGVFIDDCAYIIYAASPIGGYVNQYTITREVKSSCTVERFIHFWLGEHVSEQKRSNVAHKIQELDSYFNNTATEYRETQANESPRFLSYFKAGITIKTGLLLNSPDANRLYQLYGRHFLRCIEMKSISWEYFGADYVMFLQTSQHLYVWIGRSSSNIERRNAIELANILRANSDDIMIVDDGYEQSMPEKQKREWNSFLPLNQRVVCQSSSAIEKTVCNKMKIYKCCYRNNRLHLDQLDVVIPTKEDLNDSSTVFVLDGTSQGVWLWVGNQAPHQEKTGALGNGRAFVKKKKYPYNTPVIRVTESHEPMEFMRLFPSWHSDSGDSQFTLKPSPTVLGKFDSLTLCQRPKMAADTQLIDDGTGERKVFRILKDQVIEITANKPTVFITTSSYIVQYTVVCNSMNTSDSESVGVKQVIFQWNGVEASADVTNKAEKFAKNLFENVAQKNMFVQMNEYDETPHFLQLFEGKLIILHSEKEVFLQTKKSNSNNNINVLENVQKPDHFILKIFGDATYNAKAIEVLPLNSLNSKDCYVVQNEYVWVWCGQSSTGDAREVAKKVGSVLGENSLVMENKEPREFWLSVGNLMSQTLIVNGLNNCNSAASNGSNGCASSGLSPPGITNGSLSGIATASGSMQYLQITHKSRWQAQLFLVWTQRGKFFSQEIMGYEQSDLSPESVYILDAGILTYVWLGKYCTAIEKEKYLNLAQHYLETVPMARRPNSAVAIIRQHDEPNIFKGFFDTWNYKHWQNYVNYITKRQIMATVSCDVETPLTNGCNGSNISFNKLPPALLNNQKDFDRHQKYPITVLQQEIEFLPPEINPLKREVHLTHDDFVSLFHMSFWEFDELPAWKQQELKKKHKLF
uniref:HP domain-containing protein n=1 Tax=Glossina brevipalpis TaxID=37001 RepID=A0A1A9WZZ4_9MUSC